MSLIKNIILTIALIVLFVTVNEAQNLPFRIPYIQHDICPFECCQYGEWIAGTKLEAYKKEGEISSVAFIIKPGEHFYAIRGNVHIIKPGVAVVKKSFGMFTVGDIIYILSYEGEGVYDLWYKGKELDLDNQDLLWENSDWKSSPEMVWWVLVKNGQGKEGWLMLRNRGDGGFQIDEKISGKDSCS